MESLAYFEPKHAYLFNNFKNRFYKIPDREHKPGLREKLVCNKNDLVTGEDFLNWVLNFWPKDARQDILTRILDSFRNTFIDQTLEYRHWLDMLEDILFFEQVELEPETSEGIFCLSLNACQSVQASHVCVLGLDETNMKTPELTCFTSRDWNSLIKELGFPLSFPHPYKEQMNLQWFLQNSKLKRVHLSYAKENFLGEVQAGSILFFTFCNLKNIPVKDIDPSNTTVWDSYKYQNSVQDILQALGKPKSEIKRLLSAWDDTGKELVPRFELDKLEKISIWDISEYDKCPFRYLAKKLIKQAEDLFERDFSAKQYGTLSHQLLSKLIEGNLEKSEEEIKKDVDALDFEDGMFVHPKQETLIKERLLKLGKEF